MLKELVKNKYFIAGMFLVLIFICYIEYNQYKQREIIQNTITELQLESKDTDQKNSDLQNFITYLQTSDYTEKAARQQLNLQKSGEFVYSFTNPDAQPVPSSANAAPTTQTTRQSLAQNPKNWWNYFFNSSD
jgi:cell division protein FtsB